MRRVVDGFQRNVLQILALGLLVAGMLSASKGAAVPALISLGRFLAPLVVVYVIFRLLSKKTRGAMQRFQEQILQQATAQRTANAGAKGVVVDLCPSCGDVLKAGHRCAKMKK